MLPWLTHCTCHFSWDALGSCLWWHAALPFYDLIWPRTRLSSTMFLGNLDFLYLSSDISFSSARALSLVQSGPGLPNSLTPHPLFYIYFRETQMSVLRTLINNPFKESFYGKWKKKKIINILTAFFIFHKSGIKTFLKSLVGPTIHVREGSTHLWYSGST